MWLDIAMYNIVFVKILNSFQDLFDRPPHKLRRF